MQDGWQLEHHRSLQILFGGILTFLAFLFSVSSLWQHVKNQALAKMAAAAFHASTRWDDIVWVQYMAVIAGLFKSYIMKH